MVLWILAIFSVASSISLAVLYKPEMLALMASLPKSLAISSDKSKDRLGSHLAIRLLASGGAPGKCCDARPDPALVHHLLYPDPFTNPAGQG
jgi:hypothetical protein